VEEDLEKALLNISSGCKYEEPLPPLNESKQMTAEKEVLQDITLEDMNTSRLGPLTIGSVHESDKKFDKEQEDSGSAINVVEYNTKEIYEIEVKDGEEIFTEASLKENVRVIDKPTRNHSLEMIQEINSEFSNSNSQVSGRFTKRGAIHKQQERHSSFFTARGYTKDLPSNDYRRKVKSSRGSYVENPMFELKEKIANKEASLEKIQEAVETPMTQKKIETNSTRLITHPCNIGSGSMNYTTIRSRQHIVPQSNYDSFSGFSQSLCKRQTAGDSLVLSTAGLLSGTPYAENSGMCHSFMNKPLYSDLAKQAPGNYFFTNKKVSTLKENRGIMSGLKKARNGISIKRVHIKK